MKKRGVIVGARQHAKVVLNLLKTSRLTREQVEVVGFVDDDPALQGGTLLDLPILGKFADLPVLKQEKQLDSAIIGISNRYMVVRRKYFEMLSQLKLEPLNAIHDAAVIDKAARIGVGVVLNPCCVVNAYAEVGNNVVGYSGATIEHEDILSDNVYLGPGVNLSSGVRIGADTFVGAGVKVIPDVTIGKSVTVGAGSVIIDDIPDHAVVVGVPGKVIRIKE